MSSDALGTLIEISVGLLLVILGLAAGRINESRHLRRMAAREKVVAHVRMASLAGPLPADHGTQLVMGSVVLSLDYARRLIAWFQGVLGGRIGVYARLLERARREAELRLREEAAGLGATSVVRVRVEMGFPFHQARSTMGYIELFAVGTAVIPLASPTASTSSGGTRSL